MIDAKTAHRLGIVNHIYPADRFEAEVAKMAGKLQMARRWPFAL